MINLQLNTGFAKLEFFQIQRHHKNQVQRLAKDFDGVVVQFQAVQKEAACKQKAYLERTCELNDEETRTTMTG